MRLLLLKIEDDVSLLYRLFSPSFFISFQIRWSWRLFQSATTHPANLINMRGIQFCFIFWRDSGVSLKGRLSRLPEQPCCVGFTHLDCSTAALITPRKLVVLKMLDFSDCMRTGISVFFLPYFCQKKIIFFIIIINSRQ